MKYTGHEAVLRKLLRERETLARKYLKKTRQIAKLVEGAKSAKDVPEAGQDTPAS